MLLNAIVVLALCGVVLLVVGLRRRQVRRELEQYSIDAEALHALMKESKSVRVFDIRLPLDLLAYSEIIPGSMRISPHDLLADPSLLPQDQDAVVYCTCPSDKTSRILVNKARSLNYTRVKLLRGGLAAWKSKGYPVERYEQPFHLDTAR